MCFPLAKTTCFCRCCSQHNWGRRLWMSPVVMNGSLLAPRRLRTPIRITVSELFGASKSPRQGQGPHPNATHRDENPTLRHASKGSKPSKKRSSISKQPSERFAQDSLRAERWFVQGSIATGTWKYACYISETYILDQGGSSGGLAEHFLKILEFEILF